jgi:hypothetical protein
MTPLRSPPPFHPSQAYNSENLAALVAQKQVNTAGLTSLLDGLGVASVDYGSTHDHGWIAGPVIGGVAAAAILGFVLWCMFWRKPPAIPTTAAAAAPDAAVRVVRSTSGSKYAVHEPVSEPVRMGAQLGQSDGSPGPAAARI